jgi:hypothetical protein
VGDGGGAVFVDQLAAHEAIQGKRCIDAVGLAGGNRVGEDVAGTRRRLEGRQPAPGRTLTLGVNYRY